MKYRLRYAMAHLVQEAFVNFTIFNTISPIYNQFQCRYFSIKNFKHKQKRYTKKVHRVNNLSFLRTPPLLLKTKQASSELKRLRLEANPKLLARFTLAKELCRGNETHNSCGTRIIDLNNAEPHKMVKTAYDFLPSAKRQWINAPLKAGEYEKLLIKSGKLQRLLENPDSTLSRKDYEILKQNEETKKKYEDELLQKETNFQSDNTRCNTTSLLRHSRTDLPTKCKLRMTENKTDSEISDTELYKRFFRDRLRGLEADPAVVQHSVKELHNAKKKDKNQLESTYIKGGCARKKKQFWRIDRYATPNLATISELSSTDFRIVFYNEHSRLITKHLPYDSDLWTQLVKRLKAEKIRYNATGYLQILRCLTDLHKYPDFQNLRNQLIHSMIREGVSRLRSLSSTSFLLLLTSIAKIRMIQYVIKLLRAGVTLWPILQTADLIKGANAIANLGFGSHIYSEPLRLVLHKRLPFFSGQNCTSMSCLATLTLCTDDGVIMYLSTCMQHWESFPCHHKELHILELFLRLCRIELYDSLPNEIKGFMEYIRLGNEDSETSQTLLKECNDKPLEIPMYQKTLLRYITDKLKLIVQTQLKAGPFIISMFLPKYHMVIEPLIRENRFQDSFDITPAIQLRNHLIKAMGFKLILLDLNEFNLLPNYASKIQYLSSQLNITCIKETESLA